MSGLVNKLLTTNEVQLVGKIPGAEFASVNILVINETAADVSPKVWATAGSTPGAVDLLSSSKVVVEAGGTLEITGRIMSSAENVYVQAPAGCVVRLEAVNEI